MEKISKDVLPALQCGQGVGWGLFLQGGTDLLEHRAALAAPSLLSQSCSPERGLHGMQL